MNKFFKDIAVPFFNDTADMIVDAIVLYFMPITVTCQWFREQFRLIPYRPKLIWQALYIREDEFHSSLNLNSDAILNMSKKRANKYIRNLERRRKIAHERTL